jgi:hypothetical protein
VGSPAIALIPVFVVLFLVASSWWVYQDATGHAKRGKPVYFSAGSLELSAPAVWAAACLCLWVLVVPLYITCRRHAD